jgi:microcystin-dependent protein
MGSSLLVVGASTLQSSVTLGSTLDVSGTTLLRDNVTMNKNLDVIGTSRLRGVVTTDTDVNVGGRVYQAAAGGGFQVLLPPGCIFPYGGASVPGGYLLCDGSAVSRTTYSVLLSAIGTTYGAGDGINTFNVPDLQGRVPVGYHSTESEFNSLGETGGEKTHVLTETEMPSHAHSYTVTSDGTGGYYNTAGANHAIDLSSATTGYTGGNTAHNNLQPYITLNYIIKY